MEATTARGRVLPRKQFPGSLRLPDTAIRFQNQRSFSEDVERLGKSWDPLCHVPRRVSMARCSRRSTWQPKIVRRFLSDDLYHVFQDSTRGN